MIQIKVLCSFNILILMVIMYVQSFSHNSVGKESTYNAGNPISIPELERYTGEEIGSAGKESACNVGDLGSIPWVGKIPWRGERLPTPVF